MSLTTTASVEVNLGSVTGPFRLCFGFDNKGFNPFMIRIDAAQTQIESRSDVSKQLQASSVVEVHTSIGFINAAPNHLEQVVEAMDRCKIPTLTCWFEGDDRAFVDLLHSNLTAAGCMVENEVHHEESRLSYLQITIPDIIDDVIDRQLAPKAWSTSDVPYFGQAASQRSTPVNEENLQSEFTPAPATPQVASAINAPLRAMISKQHNDYKAVLSHLKRYFDQIGRSPALLSATIARAGDQEPLSLIDASTYWAMIAEAKPKLVMEIGSGFSTHVAHHAIVTNKLSTRLVTIDADPSSGIDDICDVVYRTPAEAMDISLCDQLQAGDILFIDNAPSRNSNVAVCFLDILPRLASGVLIHIRNICLPNFPVTRTAQVFDEQNWVAAMVLGGMTEYEIFLPNYYVTQNPDLASAYDTLCSGTKEIDHPTKVADSLWLIKN